MLGCTSNLQLLSFLQILLHFCEGHGFSGHSKKSLSLYLLPIGCTGQKTSFKSVMVKKGEEEKIGRISKDLTQQTVLYIFLCQLDCDLNRNACIRSLWSKSYCKPSSVST